MWKICQRSRSKPFMMKDGVISAFFYLAAILPPFFNGNFPQETVCDRVLTSASIDYARATTSLRMNEDMMNMAHGNGRSEKCRFLKSVLGGVGLRSDCLDTLSARCSVPQDAVPFVSLIGTIEAIPTHCNLVRTDCETPHYRTFDGSCNNLRFPRWGQVGSQQQRLLPNAYDDGHGKPRIRACNGERLPSARTVSNMIHSAGSTTEFEPNLSLLVMQMGQLLVLDLVSTKVFKRDDGSPLMCCTVDRNNPHCNPIRIPYSDPVFGSCMNFARSNASLDCSSVRQVITSESSYFDLSTVYGSSSTEAATLRSNIHGQLKNVRNKLPIDFSDSTCILSRPFDPINYYCPLAGDDRVNGQPGLSSMHTIFMREHNRLAEALAIMNPFWDDERLYQEARKINIGQWQNIVYSEFLPAILGQDVINRFNLSIPMFGYNENWNPSVDATISNAFTVAVFRYGHSQVHDIIGMLNSFHQLATQPLERHFLEPEWYHSGNGSGLENILHWMTETCCPFTDRKIQDSVRQKLFLDSFGNSFDLISLNIHRGRDHGTPGYIEYRKICGLSPVYHFGTGPGGLVDHDLEAARLLQQTYTCPDDIDLFPGLMTERRTGGSILGPTWLCLLASEFKRLRDGDRYFFERNDRFWPEMGFTEGQLNSIKSVKTADIICRNTNARSIQPNPYLLPNAGPNSLDSNGQVDCSNFQGVELSYWRERQWFI